MMNQETLSLRIAAALLFDEGEITLSEIEAIPYVESRNMAHTIAASLMRLYDTDRFQRKRTSGTVGEWDEVIRLPRRSTSGYLGAAEKGSKDSYSVARPLTCCVPSLWPIDNA